uniref:Uncharacterized protein n=1 Tax=mine drainage metagenome TaxID=410659 RepID=E6Q068_9ZZZZ
MSSQALRRFQVASTRCFFSPGGYRLVVTVFHCHRSFQKSALVRVHRCRSGWPCRLQPDPFVGRARHCQRQADHGHRG